MRSLFFKIFVIFWIAQTLIFVITTALILRHRFPHPASMLDPAFTSLHMEAAQALHEYDTKGCAGFQAFAQESREQLALADSNGTTVCGEPIPDAGPQVASTTEIYGRQIGNDTVWAFPITSEKGEKYRFLLAVHKEQHTRVGDMLHFAFPQLLVAIGVDGATTFLLVMIFTRPVIRLREAARKLARGELSTRVQEAGSGKMFQGDELHALAHDFNHMAERLQSLVDAQKLLLRDVSHELRSPLARASVALELAREDADSTMSTHLDRIQRDRAAQPAHRSIADLVLNGSGRESRQVRASITQGVADRDAAGC